MGQPGTLYSNVTVGHKQSTPLMMNKYGVVKGETEENPIKTASDEVVEELDIVKEEEEDAEDES